MDDLNSDQRLKHRELADVKSMQGSHSHGKAEESELERQLRDLEGDLANLRSRKTLRPQAEVGMAPPQSSSGAMNSAMNLRYEAI